MKQTENSELIPIYNKLILGPTLDKEKLKGKDLRFDTTVADLRHGSTDEPYCLENHPPPPSVCAV
jgi:hypothetical protein